MRKREENERLDEEEYFREGKDATEDVPFKEIKAKWSEIVLYIGGILQVIRRLQILDSERCVGCQSCMLACTRREGKASLEGSRIRVRSIGGMERGFTVIVCRACPDPSCRYVCPVSALEKRETGGVKLHKEKCIGCGMCLEACPLSAITMDEEEGKPLICVYCGYCKGYCAYGVLDIEKIEHGSSSQ